MNVESVALIVRQPSSVNRRVAMLSEALIITRREVRDSLRDWRIVAPILILTLVFPWIMNLTTRVGINFVEEYQATIIPIRLIPFGLMIVGFFPISFSLVIALETFVGEKERNSLEPLLGSPLSDASLYVGKLLAATALPLLASYIGIAAYLLWLYFSIQYVPELSILIQVLLLTTMEALVMVTGAVVVSSHTTSVRAANLLASFIIIPMAFLLQAESVLLFWGQYDVLWYLIAALSVVDAILIRLGVQTFNREEILAREVDELNPRRTIRAFVSHLKSGEGWSLRGLYARELPRILRANRLPISITVAVLLAAFGLGWWYAVQLPLPRDVLGPLSVPQDFAENLPASGFSFLPQVSTPGIFVHNTRSLVASLIVGIFSFGAAALILLMLPMALVGFIAGELQYAGTNPLLFLFAFVVPHGIIELPAAILATAFSLRVGAVLVGSRRADGSSTGFIHAFADWIKVFVFLVLPLLLIAAWVEANVTPRIVTYFFGG